jgi:hypothetical protein
VLEGEEEESVGKGLKEAIIMANNIYLKRHADLKAIILWL